MTQYIAVHLVVKLLSFPYLFACLRSIVKKQKIDWSYLLSNVFSLHPPAKELIVLN